MFWGLSGLRRNNSWSFSICHGSESGGNVSASEVCSEVGCRISTCVDLCHQVRHHQTQLHYHHHNHHLSIEMTCQWQVYVVSLHSLQMAQTCSSHTSSCLLELMISQGLRRGRLPPPDTWGIGEEMGRLFVFFCTAQWLQSSFHVVSLQCASYNMRSLDLSWIFCINDGSFMNWRARSPSHGIHCWMIFGSKRRCYGQSLRQAIWCTASCFHTHRVWVSFSRSLVLFQTCDTCAFGNDSQDRTLHCPFLCHQSSERFRALLLRWGQNCTKFRWLHLLGNEFSMSGQRAHQDVTPWAWSNSGKLEVASCWQVT